MRLRTWKEGMKIDKPCAIVGMPIEVYHSHEGLSNSGLKMLLDCPARYYYKYLSGEYEYQEKPHFKIGKAAHCYILEGANEFTKKYWHNPYAKLVKEDIINILLTKNFKETELKKMKVVELKELLLEVMGIEPKEIELTDSELNQVISLAKAIRENPLAKGAFSQKGKSEVSLFWQDEETGIWLKCRPDWLPDNHVNIPDYKTCQSVNPKTFYYDFIKYGYHVQSAMYQEGIRAVFGDEVESFFFVAQEKEPPYISQVYLCDSSITLYGLKAMRNGIEKYIECKEKGVWETYSDRVIQMSIEPKPEDLPNNYDRENSICYAPSFLDNMLAEYEV